MPKSVTKYTIFVSSPSDLKEERAALDEVVKELNLTYGKANDCVIELLKWETHSAPGITNSHTQNIINQDIGDDYDIFIGLLWKKFGTHTKYAGSGTEEEFIRAMARFQEGNDQPQILFYFKNAAPNSLSDIEPEQFLNVNLFKQNISKQKILFWEFDTVDNLQNFLRLHIPKRIETLYKNSGVMTEPLKKRGNTYNGDELGLFEYSDQFESLIADSINSLNKIAESTEWIGAEITTKTNDLKKISNSSKPSKYIVTEVLKRTAKLMSDYSDRIEIETPIFYTSFEDGIKAGINLINLAEDFANEGTIKQLKETKESMLTLRKSIPGALEGLISFRDSVSDIPRIQKDINSAKKKLVGQLDGLIEKLNRCLQLSVEFTQEIGGKIDRLRKDENK